MVRQFLQAKAEAGDSLLFFRMGDFYELFFEDALEAAELLGLTLTSRDGSDKDRRVPMCGVPVRAVDTYIARLIRAGRTVTICEQMEDPRYAKGIVKRAVIRTVTPGTVLEPDLLDERSNNFLAALFPMTQDRAGLACTDVTTGEVSFTELTTPLETTAADELARLRPAELLVPDEYAASWLDAMRRRFPDMTFTARPADHFEPHPAREEIARFYGLGTLKGIGLEDMPAAQGALGALIRYVIQTQRDSVPTLRLPRRYDQAGWMVLDASSQRNLELTANLVDDGRRGTLLSVLDRTLTPMGGRLMRQWIVRPLSDPDIIRQRLDAVETLVENHSVRASLRDTLRGCPDLERLLARISARSGNARDVAALGAALERLPRVRELLSGLPAQLIRDLLTTLDPLEDLQGEIRATLIDDPPVTLNEGGLIRDGRDAELDHLRELVRGGRDWIARLQAEERERTGIQKLKIGYNRVFGYYIEVSASYTDQVPPDYQRKQTLAGAERYVTPALKQREEELLTAQERINAREYDLFCALRDSVSAQAARIQTAASLLAIIDVLTALAETAVLKDYRKPEIDDSGIIDIRDGRHPVVEDLAPPGTFVPNDLHLDVDGKRMLIITGPNMAGKSTYLRQAALITIMAQMGSFVPAATARIGVVDRVFTRVGASDNLARGESTFMVEMIETAAILNAATPRSLIVLDEIGRGTSTFDGISIAWAVAEYLHDRVGARTLFATHYHELTELGNRLHHAKNVNVEVREYNGMVVFLYRIAEGGADHSYGIHVAQLAGLPRQVINRARVILESLKSGNPAPAGMPEQLWLFPPAAVTSAPSVVERELERVNPDSLSPREAHELLYRLKELMARPRRK